MITFKKPQLEVGVVKMEENAGSRLGQQTVSLYWVSEDWVSFFWDSRFPH